MKLATFRRRDGRTGWGIANNGGIVDLSAEAPSLRHAPANGPIKAWMKLARHDASQLEPPKELSREL